MNHKRKAEIRVEWDVLKMVVLTVTDNQLNLTFVLNSQNKGLKVSPNNIRYNMTNLFDIGKCVAQDVPTINATKINYVLHAYFEKNSKYMSDMKKTVISKLNLEYAANDEEEIMKGCIARMGTLRKNHKVILIYCIISICLSFIM